MNMRKLTAVAAFAAGYTLSAAVPEVTGVTMSQDDTRLVTITYSLADAPAVVTVDVQTNNEDNAWFSIGGEAVQNAKGDVWKKVETGAHTITWRPDLSWPDHMIADGGARAVVTAWALDNTPDYMVVDITAAAQQNTQKYYPAIDFLPGGLLDNDDYRTTSIVMRKIMAKDVTWTMGSTDLETQRDASKEATHKVTLTNNYYIGVFPVTQTQWAMLSPSRPTPAYFTNVAAKAMRPIEGIDYNEIRIASSQDETPNVAYYWPNDPNPNSYIGLLRARTGLDFELPSEAQWEFAARAGNGSPKWGDGSAIQSATVDANLDLLARYKPNTDYVSPFYGDVGMRNYGAEQGTAIVGSYAPNDWGLYDMHGNVWECCLDWYEANITANEGKVNVNTANPANTLSGAVGASRVIRGGAWNNDAFYSRPAQRLNMVPQYDTRNNRGFRLVCTAGLQ